MGNWHISIQGIGAHHNPNNPNDAEKMAAEFLHDLKEAGHLIGAATFTHGACDELHNVRYAPVAIFIDDKRFIVNPVMTGMQIKATGGCDVQYHLRRDNSEGVGTEVTDVETVALREGDRFYSHPSGGAGPLPRDE